MMTLIHKIPPNLPLQREELPLFGKEGRGEIFRCPRQFNFETLNISSSAFSAPSAVKCFLRKRKRGWNASNPFSRFLPLRCEKAFYALAASAFLGLDCMYFLSRCKISSWPSGIWRSAFWLRRWSRITGSKISPQITQCQPKNMLLTS